VKNTLLGKAMEAADSDYGDLPGILAGSTSIMIASNGNAPAKVIKEFRRKSDRPVLKGAFIDQAIFIGDNQLDALIALKSKEEMIGEVIGLLQSPAKNVISALKSGGSTIAGLVKTLSER
jgi:large subunit ribosomal protein L10